MGDLRFTTDTDLDETARLLVDSDLKVLFVGPDRWQAQVYAEALGVPANRQVFVDGQHDPGLVEPIIVVFTDSANEFDRPTMGMLCRRWDAIKAAGHQVLFLEREADRG